MAVNISDVARKAGVAIGTVSRAFNGYTDIREETRDRIFQAAKELGYIPNISARNLSSKRPPNIGLIFSGLLENDSKGDLVFQQLRGVLQYATQHKIEIAIYATDSAEQAKHSYMDFCAQHSISGTILSGITTDDAYFHELMNSGIPTVAIDVPMEGEKVGWVSIDNRSAAAEVIQALLRLGHRDVLIVAGKHNAVVDVSRSQGVMKTLRDEGISIATEDWLYCAFDEETAYQKVIERLSHRERMPDAVFCFSDVMALGVMRALKEKKLRIPEDVSVVGFDGISLCEVTSPTLSTVVQDMSVMAYEAMSLLNDIMEHRAECNHRILPHRLMLRASVSRRG